MNEYWGAIIDDVTVEFDRLVHENLQTVYETVWPALTKASTPEDRLAVYAALNWEALKAQSPELWALASKDALALQEREQERIDAGLAKVGITPLRQGPVMFP